MRTFLLIAFTLLVAAILAASNAYSEPSWQWTELYDGGASYLDEVSMAVVDFAGNLVVGGESYDGIDGSDMLFRKLDRDDQSEIWLTRVPAFDGNDMAVTGMIWNHDDDLLVCGYIRGCVG